jgi:uncharacterized RDD family membrane protein YckC
MVSGIDDHRKDGEDGEKLENDSAPRSVFSGEKYEESNYEGLSSDLAQGKMVSNERIQVSDSMNDSAGAPRNLTRAEAERVLFQIQWPLGPHGQQSPDFLPSTYRRLGAEFIDLIVCVMVFALGVLVATTQGYEPDYLAFDSWSFLLGFALLRIIYEVFQLRFQGATLGKRVLGLRVVSLPFGYRSLPWMICWIRTLTKRLDVFVNMLPQLFAFYRSDRRQLADQIAETQVIQDRQRPTFPRPRPILATLLIIFTIVSTLIQWRLKS